MQKRTPLLITYRGFVASPALDAEIRERADDLAQRTDQLLRCRVNVEAPSAHHRRGERYNVTIHMAVPKQTLVASRRPQQHVEHEDVSLAIRDAFRAAGRELDRWSASKRELPRRRARA